MKVFMTSPDGITITRLADGKLLDINPGFEGVTGWKKEEIVGRTSNDIGFWDDTAALHVMFDELKAGRSILYREFQFRRKDGILRTGIYSARTITIQDEECLVFIMHDQTELKRAEDERHRLEQQLFHSQKMDAIGKLAGCQCLNYS